MVAGVAHTDQVVDKGGVDLGVVVPLQEVVLADLLLLPRKTKHSNQEPL